MKLTKPQRRALAELAAREAATVGPRPFTRDMAGRLADAGLATIWPMTTMGVTRTKVSITDAGRKEVP